MRFSAASRLSPVPLSSDPRFNPSRDVSVIVPTIDADDTFAEALVTWLLNKPLEIIIVTIESRLSETRRLVTKACQKSSGGSAATIPRVTVLGVPRAGKRLQMSYGIRRAKGSIIILSDDDAFWPSLLLHYVLACFEDPRVGGVGTRQRARLPTNREPSVWEYLASRRLDTRNTSIMSTNYIDGSVTCLSGRTAGYRAEILQDPAFIHNFNNDLWRGKYRLDSGDDTFITRWLFAKRWNVTIQAEPIAEIETVVANSSKYLKQLLRWTRNSRRSYIRCYFDLKRLWMWVKLSKTPIARCFCLVSCQYPAGTLPRAVEIEN